MANEHLVVPFFREEAVEDIQASKREGRPVFKTVELVEVRIAGDRNFAPVFPALSMWARIDGQEISYAERWPEQYARFKEGATQIADGTPLDELPFLSVARRAELKALKIYTAEALAALEGRNLKVLSGEGYKLKEQAQAYLDRARGTSNLVAMAADNEDMKKRIEMLTQQLAAIQAGAPLQTQEVERANLPEKTFSDMSDDELRSEIERQTGTRPHHKCNRETLLNMLETVAA